MGKTRLDDHPETCEEKIRRCRAKEVEKCGKEPPSLLSEIVRVAIRGTFYYQETKCDIARRELDEALAACPGQK